MITIKPETPFSEVAYYGLKVFLAGSIEMGAAENWQDAITKDFEDYGDLIFLNPRRDSWDSSWEQSQQNPQFNYQVNWELTMLESCDIIFLYFSPGTQSPISLLELGLFASSEPEKMIVCCPEGFWRKGNVDITCFRYGVKTYNTLEEAKGALRTAINAQLNNYDLQK